MQTPTVYHQGTYTCSPKPTVVQNDDLTTETIQENVDFGPTGIVRRNLMKAVKQQVSI